MATTYRHGSWQTARSRNTLLGGSPQTGSVVRREDRSAIHVAHVLPRSNISNAFVDNIRRELPNHRQRFYVVDAGSSPFPLPQGDDVEVIVPRGIRHPLRTTDGRAIAPSLRRCDVVVVHGLFSDTLVALLLAHPAILRRSRWVVWGGDLYSWLPDRRVRKAQVLGAFGRRIVARRCAGVFTLTDGDAHVLAGFAGVPPPTGRLRYFNPLDPALNSLPAAAQPSDGVTRVLVGNSGSPTNRHLMALSALAHFADEPIEVVVPLGYGGSPDYSQSVITHGRRLFGAKFRALTELQTPDAYAEMLTTLDVALFYHDRQEGLGTMAAVCSLGKKVYTNPTVSSWQRLGGAETLHDVTVVQHQTFDEFRRWSQADAERLHGLLTQRFAPEKITAWREALSP